MFNDQCIVFHYINYIVCALNVRHPKFYRMLALFHRKYFFSVLQGREGKHSGKALTRLRSGNAVGERTCVEGLSGRVHFRCLFQAFATSAYHSGIRVLGQ